MARREPDKGSKWLIQHYGNAILRLAGTTRIRHWKALQAELVQTKQLPDGLLEVFLQGDSQPNYYLLEIAAYPEKRILEQALDDLTLAYQHLRHLPELITVILAEKGRFRVSGEYLLQSRQRLSELSIRWKVVELWTLSAEDLLAANEVGLIPWIPLTHFEGEPADLLHAAASESSNRLLTRSKKLYARSRKSWPVCGILNRNCLPYLEVIEVCWNFR